MLDTLEAGLQKIQTPDDEVRGMLQIAVPSDLGRNLLLTLFRDFRQRHPALRLRLLFSDQLTDVFKDPVDVAFRYGNNDDASFISLPVAPENRRVLVASPEWIARHGEPQTLEELSQHNALIYILRGRPFDRWSLSLDGVVQQQKVSGTVMSDDAEVIRRLAIAGEGIAYKSMLDVSDDLRAGRLRRLLPRYQGDVVPLNLICPHRKQLSAAVRLLYEEVKSHCEGLNA
ncbi:LysR family transcriptional regulator [Klebsiella pneumoniae]|nr:LysR family transcriptional regulator [Klebsiella pneumoniae]STU35085.1 LysR family transcriptional regulator [Klebsiella pneumoniae]HCB1200712.1 substrate binding domain-containing protein [Klebsiella pneumoniae]